MSVAFCFGVIRCWELRWGETWSSSSREGRRSFNVAKEVERGWSFFFLGFLVIFFCAERPVLGSGEGRGEEKKGKGDGKNGEWRKEKEGKKGGKG